MIQIVLPACCFDTFSIDRYLSTDSEFLITFLLNFFWLNTGFISPLTKNSFYMLPGLSVLFG